MDSENPLNLFLFNEVTRFSFEFIYSQTCVQRPPLGPEKSGRLTEVSDKTEI
jgi:hypothetical protein